MYHWNLPQALQDKYRGWLSQNTVVAFAEYARICCIHAPGHSKDPESETYLVAHHLLLQTHATAVYIFRSDFARKQDSGDGVIGISNCADFRYPHTAMPQDEQAAQQAMVFQLA